MKASANGKTADVFIYGEITKYAWEEYGEVSSITFKNELDELGDDIERWLQRETLASSIHLALAIVLDNFSFNSQSIHWRWAGFFEPFHK